MSNNQPDGYGIAIDEKKEHYGNMSSNTPAADLCAKNLARELSTGTTRMRGDSLIIYLTQNQWLLADANRRNTKLSP